MNKTQISSTVHSVEKALILLNILLERKSPLSLKDLSDISSFPKSTVHALLSTLRDYSMVNQKSDGRYCLGTHLFELGCAVSSSWNITGIVHPYLEKLALESNSSSFIALLDGNCGMTFDLFSASKGIQVVSELGARLPLHATCQGKMLLSGLSDDDIRYRLSQTDMEACTPQTITDIDKFLEHIAQIRKQGYAIEDGEYKTGLKAVAAPIFDRNRKVKYVLGTVDLFKSVSSPEFEKALRLTVNYAALLSKELGLRSDT